MAFAIYVDSGSNLTDDLLDEYGIVEIGYPARMDGEEFLCYDRGRDYEACAKEYYQEMRAGKYAATSLINREMLEEAMGETLEKQDVLFFPISSGVSGTYQQAVNYAQEVTAHRLYPVDTLAASFGAGLLAIEAAKLRAQGKSFEEVVAYVEGKKYEVKQFFTVEDLVYLKRGGRISSFAATIGSLLRVQPILTGTDGKITLVSKVLGRRKALHAMAEACRSSAVNAEEQTLYIAHADCIDDAKKVAEEIAETTKFKNVVFRQYDLCSGTHVGPGAIAIFFLGESVK